jgi:hypothetical protein
MSQSITRRMAPWLIGAAVLVAGAWAPRAAAPRATAAPAPAGVYVLARAGAARPPIPFAFQMAGGVVSGTVDSARVTLAADSTYTDQIVVRWTKAPMLLIPIPGLQPGPDPHLLTGAGRYTVSGSQIVLQPGDFITRGFISSVYARTGAGTLTLVGASGGLAGSRVAFNAEFTRVH